MALGDRQHVEAVAIMRRLAEGSHDGEATLAALQWLRENHPSPEVYIASLTEPPTPEEGR